MKNLDLESQRLGCTDHVQYVVEFREQDLPG